MFRVGVTRDIRAEDGSPIHDLALLDAAPDVEWEFLRDGDEVEDAAEAALGPRGVRHAAADLEPVARRQPVLDAVDRQHEHAVEDDPELLVLVAVRAHVRAGLELDHVQHHRVAEERLHPDAGHELVPRTGAEVPRLAHQPATTGFVSRPIRSTSTVISSPGFSQTAGLRKAPTPAGVPVETTSPV